MRWTVIWKIEAERRLAALWVSAGRRRAVADAANRIDQILRADPEHVGESRGRGRRILLEGPLGVIYKVDPLDRMVYVLTVWLYEKPRKRR